MGHPKGLSKELDTTRGPRLSGPSEGSFFGGQPNAIQWWYKTYWTYHDYFIDIFKLNKFAAGKDQVVYDGIFMVHPNHFITVWQYDFEYDGYKKSPRGPVE